MYTEYFGLTEPPFSIAPDPRFLFLSAQHQEALAHLVYGACESDGFIQLTGEIGSGKTTLLRRMLADLPEGVEIAFIFNPEVSRLGLLGSILKELGLAYPAGDPDRGALAEVLYRHLLAAHARSRRVVLVIDEAQRLGPDVLEEVRLLTNFETDRRKLLNVILVGQPELRDTLARAELRQLAQRVTARYHLGPLNMAETDAYIRHRLRLAGAPGRVFHPGAVRRIVRQSRGVPRLINLICDRALMAAYARGLREVSPRLVTEAVHDLAGMPAPRHVRRRIAYAGGALLVIIVAGGALAWRMSGHGDAKPIATAAGPSVVRWAAQAGSSTGAARALLARWGVPAGNAADPCDVAQASGLACLREQGNVTLLRVFDRPALVTLTRDGRQATALVSSFVADKVALTVAPGVTRRFPLHAFEHAWLGRMLVVWHPPDGASMMQRGMKGPAVAWLRRALGVPQGSPDGEFDATLEAAVRAFQRRHGLRPDGIAGPETLIVLQRVLGLPVGPRLDH